MIENERSMVGKLLCRVPETGEQQFSVGGQLVVRDGERAVLVCQGAIRGVFSAGRHTLTRDISPQGGTCEGAIYFCNVEPLPDFGWGTLIPLAIVADVAGTLEQLRGFGMVAIQVIDARRFVAHMVGERALLEPADMQKWIRTQITRALWFGLDELAPVTDLEAAAADVAPRMQARLACAFQTIGVAVHEVPLAMLSWIKDRPLTPDPMETFGGTTAFLTWQALDLAQAADELDMTEDRAIEMIRAGRLHVAVPRG